MIAVFKTNVQKKKDSVQLLKILQAFVPGGKINFDLQDCDKILRIENESIASAPIIDTIHEHGFSCTELD